MKTISLEVPNAVYELIKDERDIMLLKSLRNITKERIHEIEKELQKIENKVLQFEEKYGMEFSDFEKKIESGEFLEPEHHEDYNEWFFWIETKNRKNNILKRYKDYVWTL
ncbi:MAG: hypothetical protein ACE5KE_04265 [Methanosarcinales archaeon]